MSRARIALALTSADPGRRASAVRAARRAGFSRFIIRDASELPPDPGLELYERTERSFHRLRGSGPLEVPIVRVHGPRDLEEAARRSGTGATVAVDWVADRIIPLENLIASKPSGSAVWAIVGSEGEVPAMLGALERGADVVVVPVEDEQELARLNEALEPAAPEISSWELASVVGLASGGVGDRVLVDTTSLLRPEEGMLVGSAAALLFHVASEAKGSQFSRPRPFRVNAGAAHSYILMGDGSTRYLSELAAGDAVAVGIPKGGSRVVRVGRLKIERRPLVLVEVERDHRRFTIFVQEAETVRLSGESGPVAVTELAPGDRVFVVPFPPARHLGSLVSESIEER